MLGTLYKNITFGFVPTLADGEGVGIETAFVRFDNLFKSTWANVKIGKFELDNLLSEKRIVTLSNNGGLLPELPLRPGRRRAPVFGLGDNQIGAEVDGPLAEQLHPLQLRGPRRDRRQRRASSPGKSYDGMVTAEPGLRRAASWASSGSGSTRCRRPAAHRLPD